MFSLHTALLPPKQDAMASQFVADFGTNHQLPRFRDFDLERLSRVGRRNRVEIAFIADDTIFATSPGGHHAGIIGERLGGFLQSLESKPCKGNLSGGAMHTRVGGGVEPGQRLSVEIFQVRKMQAWPEVPPHLFHAVLDLALRLRPIRLAGLWAEACHIGKVKKTGIPMHDIVSITPRHHTFEVIVEQMLGNASQVSKSMEVTTNEPSAIR